MWNYESIFFLDKNAGKISSIQCVWCFSEKRVCSGLWFSTSHLQIILLSDTRNNTHYQPQRTLHFFKRWLSPIWIGQVLCIFIPSSPTGNLPFEYFLIISNYAKSQEKRWTVIGVSTCPRRERNEHTIHFWVRFKKGVSVPKNMREIKELFLW